MDDVLERERVINEIIEQLQGNQLTLGQAVRRLRVEVTGLQQARFARMCRISVRSLISIEQDEGNPTLKSLNLILRAFGLQVCFGLKHRPGPA